MMTTLEGVEMARGMSRAGVIEIIALADLVRRAMVASNLDLDRGDLGFRRAVTRSIAELDLAFEVARRRVDEVSVLVDRKIAPSWSADKDCRCKPSR